MKRAWKPVEHDKKQRVRTGRHADCIIYCSYSSKSDIRVSIAPLGRESRRAATRSGKLVRTHGAHGGWIAERRAWTIDPWKRITEADMRRMVIAQA